MKRLETEDVFGFIKTNIDVHTMGVYTIANILKECGFQVHIASTKINEALEDIKKWYNYGAVKQWIIEKHINRIGFSYRLSPEDGCDYFMELYTALKADNMFKQDGGPLKEISFAGLPDACEMVRHHTQGDVILFPGNETPAESLRKYCIPDELFPKTVVNNCEYDRYIHDFATQIIASAQHLKTLPPNHFGYPAFGKDNDSYLQRLSFARSNGTLPIIRTHCGPYNTNRLDALNEYNSWCRELAQSQLLDVLSIGSSQLTQSHFGEDWQGMPNGGGVPINSALEYRIIRENANPMLVRTYSGTKAVPNLARIHEQALNISWHALSFWWFNKLDGRGDNTLLENLQEHFEAIKYIATTGKPVEPNVPHHFAFRGADDITYIISGYLAAKACKKQGIKHLILQNMLNTPKYTWGVQDLAKARAMLRLVRELENENFTISLQSRAGLDYFAPDLEQAKVQLAAVTCLMDDIEPDNPNSPEIIHVVNYSEAVRLATPAVIKESIQITLTTLREYRAAKQARKMPNMKYDQDVCTRTEELYEEAREAIMLLENSIPNLYTPEGFNLIFEEGFLPVPFLMDEHHLYPKATQWQTAIKNGGIRVIDEQGNIINTVKRYSSILSRINR